VTEILFHAKRKDNGEWIEGFAYEHHPPIQCIVPKDYIAENSKWYILNTAFADWNMPREVEFIEVIPETVGRYIGICDKNKKKIFEWDVVKRNNELNEELFIIKYGKFKTPCCGCCYGYHENIGICFERKQ